MTEFTHGSRTTWLVGGTVVLAVVVLAVVLFSRDAPAEEAAPLPSTTSSATATPEPSATATPSPTPTAPAPPSPTATPTAAPPVDDRTPTSVVVSFAEWSVASGAVEVAGLADVVESDGTCTLTLTQGATTAVVTIPAEPDAASSVCGTLTVARSVLGPGRWTGVLRYSSAASIGESASFTIEVPS